MSLPIPEATLKQHLIALGKTGSGKSSALRVLVEWMLNQDRRVSIIDPKGDWWGLKLSATGKSAGFPVVIFGGEHADVPINAHAGAHVAELVATGNRPCIIDLGGWSVGDRTRFFIDYAGALFRTNKSPLCQVIDEVHNFAPQGKVMDVDAGKMLHWANRLASEGRGKNIVLASASQRPQKVHKDFVTSNETLIAMRVIHVLDRNAMKEWIDGAPDRDKGREVLESLASMQRGEAWVWSPEIGFGPKRLTFPMFKTYDSFSPQTEQGAKSLRGWAEVDLEDVKSKLASVVQEAKANDPKELKRQLADKDRELLALKQQIEKRPPAAAEKVKQVDKPVLKDGQLARVEKVMQHGDRQIVQLREALQPVLTAIQQLVGYKAPATSSPPRPSPTRVSSPAPPRRSTPAPAGESNGDVGSGGLRRILIALAQRNGLTNRQIGVRAVLSSGSGTFSTYMSRARQNGWIRDEGDRRFITDAGVAALGNYDALPTGQALLDYWLRELGESGAGRILRALADAYPNTMSNEEIGAAAEISAGSGTFSTYMSRLRTLELVQGSRGATRASEEFFES